MKTAEFFYDLPETAIAQAAIEPRDASRLLDTRTMTDHRFSDLPGLLREGDVVVVNHTRVRPARLIGEKDRSGGRVEALLLRPRGDGSWEALVRPARRIRSGTRLRFGDALVVVTDAPTSGRVTLRAEEGDIAAAAEDIGEVPLPPYFRGTLSDPERYQTVYARQPGSAAAPTAGLHFTAGVLEGLAARGIAVVGIDLEIGLDTFRPIGAEDIADHVMHAENATVGTEAAAAIAAARGAGGRVVAIGTTVVRTLETAAAASGEVEAFAGETRLFITPGYRFRAVDLVVTNFHVPGSTLVVLIAAFVGPRWRQIYDTVLARGYRFLSFGDAMLAECAR
ncbi:MAG: tRNA preQ1(34) S-adenosylmethionine ribosyltransferase-isomerase QueA [Actinobacteria bacterium RBG_16_68_21]|nr:MAG: tRNA preQ1(34) S-adenosylmethionine ribosyltransferase-isomerase QueA [Actinobacteria bacterium RBG_16_68_21]